jgi:WD40 repeat protein
MLQFQTATQQACEALEWLVVETRGDDGAGWGCHLVYRGDTWGVALYHHAFCEAALRFPELLVRSIVRPCASEALARAAFAAAPELPVQRFSSGDFLSLAKWPGRPWLLADRGKEIILWDLDANEQVSDMTTTAQHELHHFCRIAVDPNTLALVTGDGDRNFALWDLTDGSMIRNFEGHGEYPRAVVFAGDDRLISVSGDSSVRLWNRETGAELARGRTGGTVHALARSRGLAAVSGSTLDNEGSITLFDDKLEVVRTITSPVAPATYEPLEGARAAVVGSVAHDRDDANIVCLAWHPDGRHLVAGGWDFVVKMFDTETGELVRAWTGHQHWVSSVAITGDGKRIVSASSDRVRIWAVDESVCLAEYVCRGRDILVDGDACYIAANGVVKLP